MSAPQLDNRRVFAENLKFQMEKSNKSSVDVCEEIGVGYSTFYGWIKGKYYPRIDKIEALARCFGVAKAELIEEQSRPQSTKSGSNSRETFVINLRLNMAKAGKSRYEVCEAIDVNYSTFSDWCNGKKYPRIEKLELLAEYFGISVAELVGEQNVEPQQDVTREINKSDVLEIVLRLHNDAEFLKIVEIMNTLDNRKLKALKQFLLSFID